MRFTGRCYRCGNTGHLMKDCKLPRRSTGEKKPWHKKEQQKPGPDKVAKEPSEAPDATVYGPLLRELQRVGKGVKERRNIESHPQPILILNNSDVRPGIVPSMSSGEGQRQQTTYPRSGRGPIYF